VKADRAAIRARRIAMEMVDEESGRFLLHGLLS
jgi:vanillate O-demethylase monooxygenase subunit